MKPTGEVVVQPGAKPTAGALGHTVAHWCVEPKPNIGPPVSER